MADEKKTKIVIPRNGISTGQQQVRGLDTRITNKVVDALGGNKTITRASHVEPGSGLSPSAIEWLHEHFRHPSCDMHDPLWTHGPFERYYVGDDEDAPDVRVKQNSWFADLLPVNGPVLGPFSDRHAALAAEEAWLHENHIPVCEPCRNPLEIPKPTGRTSSAEPSPQWLPSARPNIQISEREIPACSPDLLVQMDFSAVEKRMLDMARDVVAAEIVTNAFRDQPMAAEDSKWQVEGDSWTCTVVLLTGERYNVTLTFNEGQASLKDQRSVPVRD